MQASTSPAAMHAGTHASTASTTVTLGTDLKNGAWLATDGHLGQAYYSDSTAETFSQYQQANLLSVRCPTGSLGCQSVSGPEDRHN